MRKRKMTTRGLDRALREFEKDRRVRPARQGKRRRATGLDQFVAGIVEALEQAEKEMRR
jgi:hypothetical protein